MRARATLHPALPLDAVSSLPPYTAVPPTGSAARPTRGFLRHGPLHAWLAAACVVTAVLVLPSEYPLAGAAATLALGVGVWVYLVMALRHRYPGLGTRQSVLLVAVSGPVAVEPPLLNSLLAGALTSLLPGLWTNAAASLLFAVTALVLLATARPGPAREGDGTLVHGVDYLLPHVEGGPRRSGEHWPEHRLLLGLQEATDRVAEAHRVLGPDDRTAEALALVRREEWAAAVRVNLRHRRGARRRGASWPRELSERDVRRPLRLGLAAHRAVAAHRHWRRLAETARGTVPPAGSWRARRTLERMEREFRRRTAELGEPGAGLWHPAPSASALREAVRRPGRARPASRVATALAGFLFLGGAALSLTWHEAFHLLLVLGWVCVGILALWTRLRHEDRMSLLEAAGHTLLLALLSVEVMWFLHALVGFLVERLVPDLFLYPGDVATALLYLGAALTCWVVAALGVGGVNEHRFAHAWPHHRKGPPCGGRDPAGAATARA